jgi:hypothetical protein
VGIGVVDVELTADLPAWEDEVVAGAAERATQRQPVVTSRKSRFCPDRVLSSDTSIITAQKSTYAAVLLLARDASRTLVRSALPFVRPSSSLTSDSTSTCRKGSPGRSLVPTGFWSSGRRRPRGKGGNKAAPARPPVGAGREPGAISNRLKVEFPDDESMRISHEAIYQALYVHSTARSSVSWSPACAPAEHSRAPIPRGHVTPEVMISERPAEVEDRAVPGHWEGDLIIGRDRSAIGALVERTTRFTTLIHLPCMDGYGLEPRVKNGPALAGYGVEAMRDALAAQMTANHPGIGVPPPETASVRRGVIHVRCAGRRPCRETTPVARVRARGRRAVDRTFIETMYSVDR